MKLIDFLKLYKNNSESVLINHNYDVFYLRLLNPEYHNIELSNVEIIKDNKPPLLYTLEYFNQYYVEKFEYKTDINAFVVYVLSRGEKINEELYKKYCK